MTTTAPASRATISLDAAEAMELAELCEPDRVAGHRPRRGR